MSTSELKKSIKVSDLTLDPASTKKPTKKKIKDNTPTKDLSPGQDNTLSGKSHGSMSRPATVKKPNAPKRPTALKDEDPEEAIKDKKVPLRTKLASTSKGKKVKTKSRNTTEADTPEDSTSHQNSKQQSSGTTSTGSQKGKSLKSSGFLGSDDDEDIVNNDEDDDDEDDPEDLTDDESEFARLYKYVPMAQPQDSARAEPAGHPQVVLYTRLMTHCWAVATHDRSSGERTLVHFQATDPDAYYPDLAGQISGQTAITVSNGTESEDLGVWNGREFKWAKRNVKIAMQEASKSTEQLEYSRLFTRTAQDENAGNEPGTFKITPDGECSRLTKEESESLLAIEIRRTLREIRARKRLDERFKRNKARG